MLEKLMDLVMQEFDRRVLNQADKVGMDFFPKET